MDYKDLLEKGMKDVPKRSSSGGRFEIPKAVLQKAGRRTIITNIFEVASVLRREPNHLIKFLLKELATKGDLEGQRLFVLGVFTTDHINKKIELYVKTFVLCEECEKPDTKLIKEGRFWTMKCEACGVSKPVK